MNKLHAIIKHLIVTGEFIKTRNLYRALTADTIENLIASIALGEQTSLTAYAFACFLLQEKETVDYHNLASSMVELLCHIPGAYYVSLYHSRRALELDPANPQLKENLLFLCEVPEHVLGTRETLSMAQDLLNQDYQGDAMRNKIIEFLRKEKHTQHNRSTEELKQKLKTGILSGEFLTTKSIVYKLGPDDMKDIFLNLIKDPEQGSYNSPPFFLPNFVLVYSFICFLIQKNNTLKYHMLAADVLEFVASKSGAPAIAIFHIKQAMRLQSFNVLYELLRAQARYAKYRASKKQ